MPAGVKHQLPELSCFLPAFRSTRINTRKSGERERGHQAVEPKQKNLSLPAAAQSSGWAHSSTLHFPRHQPLLAFSSLVIPQLPLTAVSRQQMKFNNRNSVTDSSLSPTPRNYSVQKASSPRHQGSKAQSATGLLQLLWHTEVSELITQTPEEDFSLTS